jgi:hypothetical protein
MVEEVGLLKAVGGGVGAGVVTGGGVKPIGATLPSWRRWWPTDGRPFVKYLHQHLGRNDRVRRGWRRGAGHRFPGFELQREARWWGGRGLTNLWPARRWRFPAAQAAWAAGQRNGRGRRRRKGSVDVFCDGRRRNAKTQRHAGRPAANSPHPPTRWRPPGIPPPPAAIGECVQT